MCPIYVIPSWDIYILLRTQILQNCPNFDIKQTNFKHKKSPKIQMQIAPFHRSFQNLKFFLFILFSVLALNHLHICVKTLYTFARGEVNTSPFALCYTSIFLCAYNSKNLNFAPFCNILIFLAFHGLMGLLSSQICLIVLCIMYMK